MTSAFPPSPQPRRPVRSFLLVGIPVLVIGIVVTAVLVYANQPIEELEPIGPPTPGAGSAPTTPTPTAARSFSTVPDSAGPAKGQARAFTELLREQGLACSDEHIDDRVVYSRGCYRTGPNHTVAVEFRGSPDGVLARIEIDVNYIGAPDATSSHADHDELVGVFARAAGIPERDAATIRTRLAADAEKFTVAWGDATLQRSSASSRIELRRNGWKYPILKTATLPGTLAQVTTVATKRGYLCKNENASVDCTKSLGVTNSDVERKLTIYASARSDRRSLERLYLVANTGQDDAPDRAVQEQAAVLDALGGPRSAALRQWYAAHRDRANAKAYVAGMHSSITTNELVPGMVQFEVYSPCWPDAAGFC
jgi:hypothetical protein